MSSWAVLRLYIFPFHVMWSWLNIPTAVFPSWYWMTVLLGTLQVLHVYWFFLIARIAINKVVFDKEVDDEREDDETAEALALKQQAALEKGGKVN